MKIENKFIKINNGKKRYTLKNHILDWYINYYALRQYNVDGMYADLKLNTLLIKFDAPINNPSMGEEYDVQLDGTISQEYSDNYVKTDYYYRTSDLHNIGVDLSEWYGHKIYTLGFAKNISGTGLSIGAYLDVSDYDLYLTEDGFLDVIREDLMSSDAICSGIPYHLAPLLDNKVGLVYSVGLGTLRDKMDEEYVVGEDVEITPLNEDGQYGFQFVFGGTSDFTQYPQDDLFPLINNFPTSFVVRDVEINPLETLFPLTDIYPMITNYKYVIYKYRVYEYVNSTYDLTPTDEYYLVSYPYTRRGIIKINTIYERSDV